MNLPLDWQRYLKISSPQLALLVTIDPSGRDPSTSTPHLAEQPGVIRAALDPMNVAGAAHDLPFGPWLLEWPDLVERYVPQDRRAEIADASLVVSGGARLLEALASGSGRPTCRIDLIAPGMPLSSCLPRLAGPIRGQPQGSDIDGRVGITVADGDPERSVSWPPGPIDLADYPGAPAHVAGNSQQQAVFGPYPQRVACHQIDDAGLLYHVHLGVATQPPSRFYSYGTLIEETPAVETAYTASSRRPYTRLRFKSRPPTPDGLQTSITCSGGVGLVERNPILHLLEDVGGFAVTERARRVLEQSPFVFDLLYDVQGDVLDLALEQLIPQTDLVARWRRNRIDVLPLRAAAAEFRIGLGQGLVYRIPRDDGQIDDGSVFNAFEILCGRNASTGAHRLAILRDSEHGPTQSRALCERSRRAHGRKFTQWEALDLSVVQTPEGQMYCPSGELLGDVLVAAHALPWRPLTYRASWLEGMALEVGDGVLLSDPDERFTDVPAVVSAHAISATGVDVTIATQARRPARYTPARRIFQ